MTSYVSSTPAGPASSLQRAPRRGINRLWRIRNIIVGSRRLFFVRVFGMDIDPTVQMSLSAKLDTTFPSGVHIGHHTYLAFNSRVLSHDRVRGLFLHTRIGANCFIGGNSLILPGVEIGDGSIVGAGAVVTKSVPARSIVAGNPARVVRSDVDVIEYGRLATADAVESDLVRRGLT